MSGTCDGRSGEARGVTIRSQGSGRATSVEAAGKPMSPVSAGTVTFLLAELHGDAPTINGKDAVEQERARFEEVYEQSISRRGGRRSAATPDRGDMAAVFLRAA